MNEIYTVTDSPVGELLLVGVEDPEHILGLRRLHFLDRARDRLDPSWSREDEPFTGVRAQLQEYFAGARKRFDLKLDLIGTEWELRVWNKLLSIPYGQTRSYIDIAWEVCTYRAARAVGLANARNPVAVIVPCHRVIGADGRLTGYGGGLDRKRALLDLEAGRLALAVG